MLQHATAEVRGQLSYFVAALDFLKLFVCDPGWSTAVQLQRHEWAFLMRVRGLNKHI